MTTEIGGLPTFNSSIVASLRLFDQANAAGSREEHVDCYR